MLGFEVQGAAVLTPKILFLVNNDDTLKMLRLTALDLNTSQGLRDMAKLFLVLCEILQGLTSKH